LDTETEESKIMFPQHSVRRVKIYHKQTVLYAKVDAKRMNFLKKGSNIIISIFASRSTGDGIIKELYLEHQGD